ncbi:ParB/RepB/Spo0J family partition protein [Streptomyces sp. AK02-04a]|uniref:ParB/RepB/Spo0J family partition protein n=1 Tax=Streptomyces sp. AK02-04a TaxID=3028649 RepID=UPI0029B2ABA4|nr:ParB/RepB/Spo0J family partition protein [Streptomyces sp. AK02-04a]MDX3762779.1 ParB/RepB/Spo0J family partition protein [Streptomyces sp. AK02-04a]
MSKADQLGAGRFGGSVRPVSARRQAVAAATGVPTDGIAPPTELPPDRISLNPDNPRSTLGDLTDLAGSLTTHGQKQAITVMNRDAYIKANPDRESDLEPDTTHVVVDGSSRLAAAREAQLATVKVMVSDDQGTNSEELLESALVANIHRQDLPELDEARALQRLLSIYGSQTALAKRLHRSQGWVSQRLALLNLAPELQIRIGEEPIDLLRAVASKPAVEQATALEQLKAERARQAEEKRGQNKPRSQASARQQSGARDSHYGVIRDGESTGSPLGSRTEQPAGDGAGQEVRTPNSYYGVIEGDTSGASSSIGPSAQPSDHAAQQPVPEQRAVSAASRDDEEIEAGLQVRQVPYNEPGALAMLLNVKIEGDDTFFDLLRILGLKALERDPARFGQLARSFAQQAADRAV